MTPNTIGSHPERHNLEITPISKREFFCSCSCEWAETHRTQEAARQAVFDHAVEDARSA